MEPKRKIRKKKSESTNNCDYSVKTQFPVESLHDFKGNFPSFCEPSEIGRFSVDDERHFHNDSRQLKYLVMPEPISRLHMDLNEGYSQAVYKDQSLCERLDHMLHWILACRENVKKKFLKAQSSRTSQNGFGADFVCYRGLLTTLLCTLYENKDDWLICATKFRGTIYLCAFHTEQRKERERNRSERDCLMSSWGYKLEQYMTSDIKNGSPNSDIPVNENEEFCIAIKGKLSSHVLLYSAEIDGVDPKCKEDHTSTNKYIELKTSRRITSERQDYNFCRHKLMKWWAQSFLVGITKVLCGFRDDNGIVQNVRTLQTKQMPKMAEGLWSASAGMNFCDKFLSFVKEFVVKDDPNKVYQFYWRPGQNVIAEELPSAGEYQILPLWYVSAFSGDE